MNISLKVLYPVQFSDVEEENFSVVFRDLLPKFVHVMVAPLPRVGGERLQGLGRLLHEAGDLDKEGFLANQPADNVHYLSRTVVEQELNRLTD